MIRIVLGHRGTLWRGALAALLSQEGDLQVVAEVGRSDEVPAATRRQRPDVVVLDAELPGTPYIEELCVELCALAPCRGVLVLMERWADYGNGLARLAPRVGLVATDSPPRRLIEGIRQLVLGRPVLDIDLAVAALTAESNPLTERERDVLRMSVEGLPAKVIASSLFLSAGTVRNYLSRAIAKTGARSRVEAARIAQDAGWI